MQRILWTKGLVLTPQHLQAQDRFFEELVGARVSALAPFAWGFRRLEIDAEAIAGGAVGIVKAAGIFPDGLVFDFPNADPAPPSRPFDGKWQQDQTSLDVHLAIPARQVGGRNVAADREENTRFVADAVALRDENTGLAEKPIQIARKNFHLLLEGESLAGQSTLPIARIMRTETGRYQLDPRFLPPLIDIAANAHVLAICRRLVEILASRGETLSSLRRQLGRGPVEFGQADVANFWLLHTVNTHLPVFRHLLETGGHPTVLYSAMAELAGALTSFSGTHSPGDLPLYRHADLSSTIGALNTLLLELLETAIPPRHVSLPLRMVEPSIYATALDDERLLTGTNLFLALEAEGAPDEIGRNATRLLKVGAGDQIDGLVRQSLAGVRLRHSPTPPPGIPFRLSYQYFELELNGEAWNAIRRSRTLAVFVPAEFRHPRLELLVLLPTT